MKLILCSDGSTSRSLSRDDVLLESVVWRLAYFSMEQVIVMSVKN